MLGGVIFLPRGVVQRDVNDKKGPGGMALPDGRVAAVRLGNGRHDGQPQAGTRFPTPLSTPSPGPAVESLENGVCGERIDPRPVIEHREKKPASTHLARNLDNAA